MVSAKIGTDEMVHARDEVNQEDSEQDEVDGTKKGSDSTVHR